MRTIFSIIILIAVVWLALSNSHVVSVKLFFWDYSLSFAIIVGVSFLLGFLLGVLRLAPGFLSSKRSAQKRGKSLAKTEQERDVLRERTEVLEDQISQITSSETESQKD